MAGMVLPPPPYRRAPGRENDEHAPKKWFVERPLSPKSRRLVFEVDTSTHKKVDSIEETPSSPHISTSLDDYFGAGGVSLLSRLRRSRSSNKAAGSEDEMEDIFSSKVAANLAESRLQSELSKAVGQVAEEVADHMTIWESPQLPEGYFDPFAQDVVNLLERFYLAYHSCATGAVRQRRGANQRGYEREKRFYQELPGQPAPKPGRNRSVTRASRLRPDEEVYIFEPLRHMEGSRQKAMMDIINTRLRAILSDPHGIEKLQGVVVEAVVEERPPTPVTTSPKRDSVAANGENARMLEELAALRAEKDRLKKEKQKLRNAATQNLASANQELADAQAEFQNEQDRKEKLTAEIAELRKHLKDEDRQLEALRNQVAKAEAEILELTKKLADLRKQKAAVDAERKKKELQLEQLKTKTAAAAPQGHIAKPTSSAPASAVESQSRVKQAQQQAVVEQLEEQDYDEYEEEAPAAIKKSSSAAKQVVEVEEEEDESEDEGGSAQYKEELARQQAEEARRETERQKAERRIAELQALIEAAKKRVAAIRIPKEAKAAPEVGAEAPKSRVLIKDTKPSAARLADNIVKIAKSEKVVHNCRSIFKRLHGEADKNKLKMNYMQNAASRAWEEKLLATGQVVEQAPDVGETESHYESEEEAPAPRVSLQVPQGWGKVQASSSDGSGSSSVPAFRYPSKNQISALARDGPAQRKAVRDAAASADESWAKPRLPERTTSKRPVDEPHPDDLAVWQSSRRSSLQEADKETSRRPSATKASEALVVPPLWRPVSAGHLSGADSRCSSRRASDER